ncbi:MAG: hypothetical protein ACN4E2_07135, partial [Nitrospinota bacterium]
QMPTVSVATDLDGKITKGLGASFSKEASAYTQQLKSKLEGISSFVINRVKIIAGYIKDATVIFLLAIYLTKAKNKIMSLQKTVTPKEW